MLNKVQECESTAIKPEDRITPKDAGYRLGIGHRTVLEYIRTGKLKPQYRSGSRPFFTEEYIEQILRDGYEPSKRSHQAHHELENDKGGDGHDRR